MSRIIKIPANSQALMLAIYDANQQKYDVIEMEYNYMNAAAATFPAAWAYWKMDETSGTRVDATGNGNDLTPVTHDAYGTGLIGNSYTYYDHDDYAKNESISFDLSGASIVPFTIAIWFKISWAGAFGNLTSCVVKFANAGSDSLQLGFDTHSADGKIQDVWGLCSNAGSTNTYWDYGDINKDADVWHLLLCWQDESGFYVSIDDETYTTVSTYSDPPTNGFAAPFTSIYIGNNPDGGWIGTTLRQAVDLGGIWIGANALTPAQRSQFYNAGAGYSPY